MVKVQITGLPCSGKTTAIQQYIRDNPSIEYIDIRSFTGKNRFNKYRKTVLTSNSNLIAESASGIEMPNTYVIRLDTDKDTIYKRTLDREGTLDEYYLSLIETEMIKPQYTATDVKGLYAILDILFTRS